MKNDLHDFTIPWESKKASKYKPHKQDFNLLINIRKFVRRFQLDALFLRCWFVGRMKAMNVVLCFHSNDGNATMCAQRNDETNGHYSLSFLPRYPLHQARRLAPTIANEVANTPYQLHSQLNQNVIFNTRQWSLKC